MPRIIRVNKDQSQGHSPATKTQAIQGSPDVFVGNDQVVRAGDAYSPHQLADMISPPHPTKALATSRVYANKLSIQVDGDPLSCGDIAKSLGDHQVFIG